VGSLADAPHGFQWPLRGRVIAGFGASVGGAANKGIDLAVAAGTDIRAAEDGVVLYAGNEIKDFGNLLLLRHRDGFLTAYAHAQSFAVKPGDSVRRGQVIAKSGQTGAVTSPQLHFEIRKDDAPVDPAQYLPPPG
jgi:murein DD-endopeptidase MepM/ murein hydrolase activator NlpD